jgi:uncharacterized protein YjdB
LLKSKKLNVAVLAVFFLSIFAGFGVQPAAAAVYPTDITGNWAGSQIYSLINQGVVTGYVDGTFKPNNSISRAEFIVMINRAFKFNTPASIFYSDVRAGDWFYLDIAKARAAGYIAGYPNGTMGPNNKISRQEAATILAGVLGLNTSTSSGYLTFSDASKIPSWSWASINSLVQAGYINGYPDGTFRPANSITRAEAAVMINQGMSRVKVTSVKLNKDSLTLGLDKSETLVATVSPSNATNQTVTWSSSNPAVASVSSNGKLTGLKEGTTTITVRTSDGGKTATCKVTVKDVVKVKGVRLNESSVTLGVDDTYTLKATVNPSDATNTNVTWKSSNTSVATVNSSGKVTAKKEGTATITVTTEDGSYKATCKVTVKKSYGSELSLSDDEITMDTYDETTVKAFLPKGYDIDDVKDIWWESDDDDIADVDEDYDEYSDYIKFTINSFGVEDYTHLDFYIRTDDNKVFGDTCKVTVEKGGGDLELALSSYSMTLYQNGTDEKTVKGTLRSADADLDIVSWEVIEGDENIIYDVDIDEYDDYFKATITAGDRGTCKIRFTVETDEGDEAEADLKVTVRS